MFNVRKLMMGRGTEEERIVMYSLYMLMLTLRLQSILPNLKIIKSHSPLPIYQLSPDTKR